MARPHQDGGRLGTSIHGPSTPHSQRTKARQLLKQLKERQSLDISITATTCLQIKYLFKSYSRVKKVKVAVDETFYESINISRHKIPNFVVSQLEGQRLISANSPQVPVNPPLFFILSTLSEDIPSAEKGIPTVFIWHLPETHRTYWVFAFLSIKMATAGYSVEHLLSLRNSISPRVEERLTKLAKQHPDIRDVIRIQPTDILRTINIGSTSNLSSKRAGRARVDALPAIQPIKEHMSHPQTQIQPQSMSHEPVQGYQAPQQLTPQKLALQQPQPSNHGRGDTETSSSESLPKSTDLPAQEVEGFKKFYKAVVSPSHVRVTAGGRIVPNNRAPGSPTPKATRPNLAASTTSTFGSANPPPFHPSGGNFSSVRSQTTAYGTLPATSTQVLPQLPTQIRYLPTDQGWVQIPIAFAPAGCAVMKSPYPAGSVYTGSVAATRPTKEAIGREKEPGMNQPSLVGTALPAIPGSASVYPQQFITNPGLVIPQVGGSVPSRRNQSPNSAARGGGYHPSMVMGTALSSALNLTMVNPVQPTNPPVSSIRASEITKCHIERMKEVIKYNEDQIQLNKHQIDEKALREQNDQVMALINTFQKTYEMQIKVEERFEAKDKLVDLDSSNDSNSTQFGRATASHNGIHEADLGSESTRTRHGKGSHVLTGNTLGPNFDQSRASGAIGVAHHQQRDVSQDIRSYRSGTEGLLQMSSFPVASPNQANQAKSSNWTTSLPRGAATAAPFQPRHDLTPAERAYYTKKFDSPGGRERQFEASTRAFGIGKPELHVSFGAESGFQGPTLGTPYLCGQVPPGGNPRDGYVYNRDLTEEEKQSRYLYWGRASRAARKGLPKFDGQHFYPPSPAKERESVQGLFKAVESGASKMTVPKRCEERDPFRGLDAFGKLGQQSQNKGTTASPIMMPGQSLSGPVGTRTSSEFLRKIIKKGPAGGNALPGTVSSMTAQGVLPQYTGHAAASLTPAMAEPSPPTTAGFRGETAVSTIELPDAELKLRELTIEDLRKGGLVVPGPE